MPWDASNDPSNGVISLCTNVFCKCFLASRDASQEGKCIHAQHVYPSPMHGRNLPAPKLVRRPLKTVCFGAHFFRQALPDGGASLVLATERLHMFCLNCTQMVGGQWAELGKIHDMTTYKNIHIYNVVNITVFGHVHQTPHRSEAINDVPICKHIIVE